MISPEFLSSGKDRMFVGLSRPRHSRLSFRETLELTKAIETSYASPRMSFFKSENACLPVGRASCRSPLPLIISFSELSDFSKFSKLLSLSSSDDPFEGTFFNFKF